MSVAETSDPQVDLVGIETKVRDYLMQLPPDFLGVERCEPVEVLLMTPGAYNLNYHVKVGGKRFIFRVNIEQQSGLTEQIAYEYHVMKFMEGYDIAPRAYHMDDSKQFFQFDVMIEEYLEGPHVSLTKEDVPSVAELLNKIHSLPCQGLPLITWNDPLADTLRLVEKDLEEYEAKITPDAQIRQLARECLEMMKHKLDQHRRKYAPDGMNHTDDAIDNFIKTAKGLRMIDWEKPRYDDCSYDVCCFLARPAQLWCAPETLPEEGAEIFLQEYIALSGKEEQLFREKVRIRQPLVSLHWVMWGANKLCDLRDRLTFTELQTVHKTKVMRWERMTTPAVLEAVYREFETS